MVGIDGGSQPLPPSFSFAISKQKSEDLIRTDKTLAERKWTNSDL